MANTNTLSAGEMLKAFAPTNKSKEFTDFTYETVNQLNKVGATTQLIGNINNNIPFFYKRLEFMMTLGLSLVNAEFYIFIQKGGNLTIDPTPKGLKKVISKISGGSVVVPQTYTIYSTDKIEFPTINGFDTINYTPDAMATLTRANPRVGIVGIISHIKIFNSHGVLIATNNIIMPQGEVEKVLKASGSISTNYFSTWTDKTINKRVLKWLLSVFNDSDGLASALEEDMRQDEDSASVAPIAPTELTKAPTPQKQGESEEQKLRGKEVQKILFSFRDKHHVEISTIINHFSKNGYVAKMIKTLSNEEIEVFLNMLLPQPKPQPKVQPIQPKQTKEMK